MTKRTHPGILSAILACYPDGSGGVDPLLCRQIETIAPGLISNFLEFEGIEDGVIDLFPNAGEQHSVFILQSLFDQ